VPWGRSTGVLAVALTVELAALALAHDRVGDRAASWLRRGLDATRTLERSFDRGLSTAHQYRDQDAYRGPARRLQLTLDVLGKAAYAAATLRRSKAVDAALAPAGRRETYRTRDELIRFEEERPAAVWAMRGRANAFVMPFVGAARSHYLAALHDPGRFEVPVDADLPCWTPLVVDGLGRYTAGGVPRALEHEPARVRAEWEGFTPTALIGKTLPDLLEGSRAVSIGVDGRSIVVDDELRFAKPPDSIAVVIPETASLPLIIEATGELPPRVTSIDVAGLAEWRSSWSELAVAHQLEFEPATTVRYSLRVTPKLRVASTAFGHHYHECLYGPLADRVVTRPSPFGFVGDPTVELSDVEVFHVHWPEWVMFDDLAEHERVIQELRDHDVSIVWTAHNLTPHDRRPDVYDPIYARWADAADAVIHHSKWGEQRIRERYQFRSNCRHRVIGHGHWGPLWDAHRLDRDEAGARLGLGPCTLRVGLVGAPRADKRVVDFLSGVTRSNRSDMQAVCWSLLPGEVVPDDPRIAIAKPYRNVDRATYATYLSACDVIALPFVPDSDMLATGTAFDAIALGLPSLITDWPYLAEVLGDAGIRIELKPDDVGAALDALDDGTLETARRAARACRAATEWRPIAEQTFALLDELFESPPS
jgi:glycosyltransferase involved in cell wall biosynthesis